VTKAENREAGTGFVVEGGRVQILLAPPPTTRNSAITAACRSFTI
jgi:hypothetical protein